MPASARRARLLNREDVQPLLLELTAEPGLAIGDVHAFDDLSARCSEPAAIFHSSALTCA
jgi:hypothetical protein